jgi:hypothetical protein
MSNLAEPSHRDECTLRESRDRPPGGMHAVPGAMHALSTTESSTEAKPCSPSFDRGLGIGGLSPREQGGDRHSRQGLPGYYRCRVVGTTFLWVPWWLP